MRGRRGAMAAHTPERAHVPAKPRSLDGRHSSPEFGGVRSQRIHRPHRRHTGRRQVAAGTSEPPGETRDGRVLEKVLRDGRQRARRRPGLHVWRQAPARNRHDGAAMPAPAEAADDVDRGQAGADEDDDVRRPRRQRLDVHEWILNDTGARGFGGAVVRESVRGSVSEGQNHATTADHPAARQAHGVLAVAALEIDRFIANDLECARARVSHDIGEVVAIDAARRERRTVDARVALSKPGDEVVRAIRPGAHGARRRVQEHVACRGGVGRASAERVARLHHEHPKIAPPPQQVTRRQRPGKPATNDHHRVHAIPQGRRARRRVGPQQTADHGPAQSHVTERSADRRVRVSQIRLLCRLHARDK